MINEIVSNIKADDLETLLRIGRGCFDKDIIKTKKSLGCKYFIKGKVYPALPSQATD